jgi:hypothetical protein
MRQSGAYQAETRNNKESHVEFIGVVVYLFPLLKYDYTTSVLFWHGKKMFQP